jgi:hypothetical protein
MALMASAIKKRVFDLMIPVFKLAAKLRNRALIPKAECMNRGGFGLKRGGMGLG